MQRKKQSSRLLEEELEENHSSLKVGQNSVRGKYQQQYKTYLSNEYTYTCYEFVKRICSEARVRPQLKDLPLNETLTTVSKILFLNELEFLFLSCLLREVQWQIFDETITKYAPKLKLNPPTENSNLKCLYLFILVAAFSVKAYLNDNVRMFESELHDMLPEFPNVFHNWGSKFAKSSLGLNPKLLNSRYAQFTEKPRKLRRQKSRDFNAYVDVLVESMPAPDSHSEETIKQEHSPQQNSQSGDLQLNNQNRLNIEIEMKLVDEPLKVAAWPMENDSLMSIMSLPRYNPPGPDYYNNLDISPRETPRPL